MASLNQLASEIAHVYGEPYNVALKEVIKSNIIHLRNQELRRSYSSHGFIDQGVKQLFKIEILDINKDDIGEPTQGVITKFRRTKNKILRPVRMVNNVPFTSVRIPDKENDNNCCSEMGFGGEILPFIQTDRIKYYANTNTMSKIPKYTYMNDYLYVWNVESNYLIVEGIFEKPHEVSLEIYQGDTSYFDDYPFFIPDDLVPAIFSQLITTKVNKVNEPLLDGDNK